MLTVLTLTWVSFGFLIALLAHGTIPQSGFRGIALTVLLGAAGACLGGILGNVFVEYPILRLHPAGFLGSAAGSALSMFVVGGLPGRRVRAL